MGDKVYMFNEQRKLVTSKNNNSLYPNYIIKVGKYHRFCSF